MKLTSKCQMTVPKEVRESLGLGPGSDVGIERNAAGEYVLVNLDARKTDDPGRELVRKLKEIGERARREGWHSGLGTDEIMDLTRGPRDEVDHR
jgi:AbrB family looped-hinge helix DNA binding protein